MDTRQLVPPAPSDQPSATRGFSPAIARAPRASTRPRWVIPLATVLGIRVDLHASFLLLLAWIGIERWSAGDGLAGSLQGVLSTMAVFASVVLHEFSHALTARRFGIRTRDITLYPIGGVARLERMPDDPLQELLVALAGPAFNLAFATVLWLGLRLSHAQVGVAVMNAPHGFFVAKLMWINLSLALFNLTPAFPMDGGRMLRAGLSLRLPRERATATAARVGQGMALLMGLVGLLASPMLVLVAIFVWFGARSESESERIRAALHGLRVADAMVTEFATLAPRDTLAAALDRSVHGFQRDFLVVDRCRVVGVITHADVLQAVERDGADQRVERCMRTAIELATGAQRLDEVYDRLRAGAAPTVVLDGPEIRGMLTLDSVEQLLLAKQVALAAQSARGPRQAGRGAAGQVTTRTPVAARRPGYDGA